MANICTECGEQVDPTAEFCPACLATIGIVAPQPAPVPPPASPLSTQPQPAQKSSTPWIIGAFVGGLLIAGAAYRLTTGKEQEARPPVAAAPESTVQTAPPATVAPAMPAPQPASPAPQPRVQQTAPAPPAATAETGAEDNGTSFDWQPANLDPNGDNWLALRSEPDLRGFRIDKLDPGTRFKVLAKRSGWWKVELADGRRGWVSAKYVGRGQ
jgi:hypothetical protein